jgi:aminomethyltransferase
VTATAALRAAALRRGAGCFPDLARGVALVTGSDRRRWLNGMLSADVGELAVGEGRYALQLSPQGRILADFQVIERGDRFWLDTAADRVGVAIAQLSRYVIADDVALSDASGRFARIGIEGPAAPGLIARLCGGAPSIAADGCVDVELAGQSVAIAAFGWSGEAAYQLFAPAHARAALLAAIARAGGDALVDGDADVLEVLRIEAGIPRMGHELGPEVLPAEVGLVERAVSLTKGCFTGQEIVARMHSRGQPSHRLVGLRFEGDAAPAPGPLARDGKRVGDITSACRSSAGAIGLGLVRLPHDAPGTELRSGDRRVRVVPLPHVGEPRAQVGVDPLPHVPS